MLTPQPAAPRYVDHIGCLEILDGDALWTVYVTTGAIEKLSRTAADDESLSSNACAFEEIARRKLRSGDTLSNSIWVRSLDLAESN